MRLMNNCLLQKLHGFEGGKIRENEFFVGLEISKVIFIFFLLDHIFFSLQIGRVLNSKSKAKKVLSHIGLKRND